jgi:hypothetical protein
MPSISGSLFFQPHPEEERRPLNKNHDDSVDDDDDYKNDDKDVVHCKKNFDFPDSEFVMKIPSVCHSTVVLKVHQLQYWYAVPVFMILQMYRTLMNCPQC